MDPEQRHKRALELADELNNDPLLSADMEIWLNDDTKGRLTGVDVDALKNKIDELKQENEKLSDDLEESEKEKDRLEELLNGKPE